MTQYQSRRPQTTTVAIARQASPHAENTTDGDFVALQCSIEVEHDQGQENLPRASGQFGASVAPSPGGRKASVKLSGVLQGAKSGYAYATDAIDAAGVLSPVMALLGAVLGSGGAAAVSSAAEFARGYHLSRVDFTNGAITGGSAASWETGDKTPFVPGALGIVVTDANETTPTTGWIATIADGAPTPDIVTPFAPSANAPAASDDLAPSATAWWSSLDPVPLTIRLLGDDDGFKRSYVGFIAESLKISVASGQTIKWEVAGRCIARTWYSTGGGLVAPAAFADLPAWIPRRGGRLVVDGAAMDGVDGIEIEVAWDLVPIPGSSTGSEGVKEYYRQPRAENPVTIKMVVPITDGDSIASGLHQWETMYEAGTAASVQIEIGKALGAIGSILMPAIKLAAPPKLVDWQGLDAHELLFRPSTYVSDTGSTAPADTLLRLGVG